MWQHTFSLTVRLFPTFFFYTLFSLLFNGKLSSNHNSNLIISSDKPLMLSSERAKKNVYQFSINQSTYIFATTIDQIFSYWSVSTLYYACLQERLAKACTHHCVMVIAMMIMKIINYFTGGIWKTDPLHYSDIRAVVL